MAKLNEVKPFDFSPRGGTIHELGDSYVTEMANVYKLLNELRENAAGTEEPQPHQLKISDSGKLYIRNTANTDWVYMGDVKENFGLNELGFVKQEDIGFTSTSEPLNFSITGNAGKIAETVISVESLDEGEALVYNALKKAFVNRKVPVIDEVTGTINVDTTGNAGKIAGRTIKTENLEDGEILVYRASVNAFVNETRVAGVGAKALSISANGAVIATYSGTTTVDVPIVTTGADEPEGSIKPPFWLKG